jgi:hypothetical protein
MFSAFLTLLSIALAVCATPHIHQNRHHNIAKRHSSDVQLYKRFTSARWTYYDVGLSVLFNSSVLCFAHKYYVQRGMWNLQRPIRFCVLSFYIFTFLTKHCIDCRFECRTIRVWVPWTQLLQVDYHDFKWRFGTGADHRQGEPSHASLFSLTNS